MHNDQNPAQPVATPATSERVQPGSPASGEVKERGDFTLDTSGQVAVGRNPVWGVLTVSFRDLPPFAQGYVEALFADARPGYDDAGLGGHYVCGFSDLSPEALGMILQDCERIQGRAREGLTNGLARPTDPGGAFWRLRQRGIYGDDFPPLTPFLADDGKVHLREAQ